jgi:predicted nucleic acid-binding protein
MPGFVADASLTLSWCFTDEATYFSAQMLDRATSGEAMSVPAHWPTEVLNGILKAKRRGRVTEAEVQYFFQNLCSFDLSIDGWRDLTRLGPLQELAERHGLTSYDAA